MFHPDTSAYIRGPDYALQYFFRIFSEWSLPATGSLSPSPAGNSPAVGFILSGRSIYYGFYLYLSHWAGHLWPAILGQSLMLATGIHFTVKQFFPNFHIQITSISIFILAFLTPLPFFVSYLMPDILAGLTILAFANLTVFGQRLGWIETSFWALVLSFGALSHSTVVLIIVCLCVISVPLAILYKKFMSSISLKFGIAAVFVAVMGGFIFNYVVEVVFGNPPLRPPFLVARLIEDGPGYTYLKATCPDNGSVLCSKLDQLPLPSDAFLWGPIFAGGSIQTKRAIVAEQPRFILGTMMHDPVGQIAVSLKNWLKQTVRFGLTEFNYSDNNRAYFMVKLPPSYAGQMQVSFSYRGLWPINMLAKVFQAVAMLSLIAILAFLFGKLKPTAHLTSGRLFAIIVVAGILANSLICGVLSGPHDRYQARVIWLLPLMAVIVATIYYHTGAQRRPLGTGNTLQQSHETIR